MPRIVFLRPSIIVLLCILAATDTVVLANAGLLAPPAPTDVQASDGTYCMRIRITWSGSEDATYYYVHRRDNSGGANLVQVAAGQTWFDDVRAPYLRANVSYYYSIQGCNDDGCGPISGEDTGWCTSCAATPTPTDYVEPTRTPTRTRTPRPTATRTRTPRCRIRLPLMMKGRA